MRWVPLVLFLLALALQRPLPSRGRDRVSRSRPTSATVVLLVDVSGSMRADDVKPTRLGAAAARDVRVRRASCRSGEGRARLSSRASPTFSSCPTTDRGVDAGGDRPPAARGRYGDRRRAQRRRAGGRSLGVGDAPRDRDGKIPGAIVLLSDGAQTRGTLTPLQGADLAKRAGIRVFTIALGTNHGTLGGFVRRWRRRLLPRRRPVARTPRPGDARGDRARHRRQDLPRAERVEGRQHLQGARLEHRAEARGLARSRRGSQPPRRCFCSARSVLRALPAGGCRKGSHPPDAASYLRRPFAFRKAAATLAGSACRPRPPCSSR